MIYTIGYSFLDETDFESLIGTLAIVVIDVPSSKTSKCSSSVYPRYRGRNTAQIHQYKTPNIILQSISNSGGLDPGAEQILTQ